jgi:hypothetical protein
MDERVVAATRRALHGVAELLIAGPQYRASGTIRLRVLPGGFGGVLLPVRVRGHRMEWDGGAAPLRGTCRELAAAAGIEAGAPAGLYRHGSGVELDEPLELDAAAAELLVDWLMVGDGALRAFAPGAEPVLWPEHFDLGISLDEVNYGVSPGDLDHSRPYAYIGPWAFAPGAGGGPFWNAPFGAARSRDELPDAAALTRFFAAGQREWTAISASRFKKG